MLFLTTEELEKQGVSRQEVQESTQITCSDKLFTRVANFPKQERSQATSLGKEFLRSGVFSFISESQEYLTVWKEKTEDDSNHLEQQKDQSKKARATSVSKIFTNHRDTSWQAIVQKLSETQAPVANSLQPLLTPQDKAFGLDFIVSIAPLTTRSESSSKQLQISPIKSIDTSKNSKNGSQENTVIVSQTITSVNLPSAHTTLKGKILSTKVTMS